MRRERNEPEKEEKSEDMSDEPMIPPPPPTVCVCVSLPQCLYVYVVSISSSLSYAHRFCLSSLPSSPHQSEPETEKKSDEAMPPPTKKVIRRAVYVYFSLVDV